MSLKAFHIFFVVIAALLCLGFGVWCFQTNSTLAGSLSFATVVALAIFEVNFLRRMKGVK